MINVPFEQIIEKIKENGLTQEQIDAKIKQKTEQLSGLISKEGAAHIIANELGIKLVEQTSGKLKINNLLSGMRNVELLGKVQQVYEVREFQTETRSGKVGSMIIGDDTGTVRLVLWGNQTDKLSDLEAGDIVKVEAGYVKSNNNRNEVHLGDRGTLKINPEGETIAEVKVQEPKRKSISDLKEGDADVELLGTIVQVYDIRFFESCPQCNRKLKPTETGFLCENHSNVTPAYSYVLGLVLDDGTSNIRSVFFKNQIQNLLEKTHEDIEKYKEFPEKFEEVKHDLLGKQLKLIGKINKNMMMDRIEFVAQRVFPKPNPDDELNRLEETKTKSE
ncbi:OB-fold nucleic acid binding domain-containing protein [candidate division KSB1 bacterium]